MDFYIPDADLINNHSIKHEADKAKRDQSVINLTFVDSDSFKNYLGSNEYNDPIFHSDGCLYSLVKNNDLFIGFTELSKSEGRKLF